MTTANIKTTAPATDYTTANPPKVLKPGANIAPDGLNLPVRIPAAYIKAAAIVAPKADIRYYLNGVAIDMANNAIYATDGHRALIIRDAIHTPINERAPCESIENRKLILLSHDHIKALLTGAKIRKGSTTHPTALLHVSETCIANHDGTVVITPQHSERDSFRYPDMRRVMPGTAQWIEGRREKNKESTEPAGVNADYIADWAKIMKAAGETVSLLPLRPVDAWPTAHDSSPTLYLKHQNIEYLIMCLRLKSQTDPEAPDHIAPSTGK